MERKCDRRGHTWLYTADSRRLVMPTTCKTYACKSCQPGLLALFRARLEIGTSRLGRCAFITVTYRHTAKPTKGRPGTSRSLLHASACATDWQALQRRLRSAKDMPEAWLKVTELTKAGTPHHHLVIGPVKGKITCHGSEFKVGGHIRRMDTCGCLSHVWSRHWLAVTGDSYIVHATAVLGPKGAGWYLLKYMAKTHSQREAMEGRGFKRRWSSSRSWPGGGRLRLWQTTHGGWVHHGWAKGRPEPIFVAQNDPDLLRRDGENLTLILAKQRNKVNALRKIGKLANAQVNWT